MEEELRIADVLHSTFGDDITLLQEYERGTKKPDYLWRGRYWELKTVSSAKAVDSALRKAIKQIQNNPGGVVLNCSKAEVDYTELKSVIANRSNRSAKSSFDILIMKEDAFWAAFRWHQ